MKYRLSELRDELTFLARMESKLLVKFISPCLISIVIALLLVDYYNLSNEPSLKSMIITTISVLIFGLPSLYYLRKYIKFMSENSVRCPACNEKLATVHIAAVLSSLKCQQCHKEIIEDDLKKNQAKQKAI